MIIISLDSFLSELEDKINHITEGCNSSINSVKDQITQKTDKYINENFNDIRYSSDNINKCINDGIDKLFSGDRNKQNKKLIDEGNNNLNEDLHYDPLNKPKINLQKK